MLDSPSISKQASHASTHQAKENPDENNLTSHSAYEVHGSIKTVRAPQ